ncbi:MAG: ATP phosphoribosyltransferase regulatory subunit [Clostridia bacterium]|nr:ATP phosphoribosyltransferase regulatory subunit [Clostridia bacterium]
MDIKDTVLKNEEIAIFKLRQLYGKYGYSQYKMSKFEEYELYVRNKDFLVSDSIITFTDTNGKLLALKPDVTLSIIKNTKDEKNTVNKVYYNENVYRISKGAHSFKEIMQSGLECIGDIDNYNIYEVLMLACESLKSISEDCVLDISSLSILSDVIENISISEENRKNVLKCASEKNTHEIARICAEEEIPEQKANALKKLISTYGSPEKVIDILKNELSEFIEKKKIDELSDIVNALVENGYGDMIRIDFSVINDMNYYNGIVFKGFINTIPTGVLSGGQYDKLMQKMGRKTGAIGFAVYLDLLERFNETEKGFDVDTVILYNDGDSINSLNNAIKMMADNGKSVMAQKAVPKDIKYKQLLKLNDKGVVIIENNA